ncbi:hypothetical protein J4427_00695 [Candidatus Woesearchaeota archaeon]|nr:hypothetical protein [Candidatus Woesearchaeota archaeon]
MIKIGDTMREFDMLQHLGLKDYEIAYLRLVRLKENNKRHWNKSYV